VAWRIEEEPPPTSTRGRPLSAKGERTRRSLLDAAEQVFAALGYHDASIVKITEAAEVAQGTFYIYFESKRQIFDELVADLNRRVRRAMSEGARQGRTRAEAERLGFLGFFRFTAEHPALYQIVRQAEFASPNALRRHYRAIADGYIGGLRAAMDEGEIAVADPEVVAWALMGVGEMIGMRWILWQDEAGQGTDRTAGELPEQVFEEMYAFIRRGLGTS
jgi:AcrR family transcriptional regulator